MSCRIVSLALSGRAICIWSQRQNHRVDRLNDRWRMIGTIVISGSMAQKPCQGGHASVFLQYILGFRKLGWDVLFLDQLEQNMCVDSQGNPCALEESVNLHS